MGEAKTFAGTTIHTHQMFTVDKIHESLVFLILFSKENGGYPHPSAATKLGKTQEARRQDAPTGDRVGTGFRLTLKRTTAKVSVQPDSNRSGISQSRILKELPSVV